MRTDNDMPNTEPVAHDNDTPRYPYVHAELLPALQALAARFRRPREPGGVEAARALVESLVIDDAGLAGDGTVALEELPPRHGNHPGHPPASAASGRPGRSPAGSPLHLRRRGRGHSPLRDVRGDRLGRTHRLARCVRRVERFNLEVSDLLVG